NSSTKRAAAMPLPMTTRGSLIAFPQSCKKCAPLRLAAPCSLVERWRLPIAIGIDGDVPAAISRSMPLGPGGLSKYISMAWWQALDRGGRPAAPAAHCMRVALIVCARLCRAYGMLLAAHRRRIDVEIQMKARGDRGPWRTPRP